MRRYALLASMVCAAAAQIVTSRPPVSTASAPSRSPILVELFTSEGCSDCPPADHMLQQLDPHVVVLSEHVDYWDNLGWRDRFSSHEFTLRQEEYARRFRIEGPYTPQMVVDGSAQFVGSDAGRAKEEIERAGKRAKARIELAVEGVGIRVHIGDSPASGGVFLGLAQDSAASDVAAGENRGRHLLHVAVLRNLRKIGSVKRGGEFQQMVALTGSEQRVIVFVQDGTAGPVFGAAELAR